MRTAVPVLLAVYAYFITPPWHSLRWDYLKTLTDSSRLHQPNLNPYIQSSVGQPAEGVAHAGLAHALARNLTGKVAVVTGGNAGLGFATVKRLAKQGATVIMGARDPQKAMAAIQSLGLGVDVGFSQLDLVGWAIYPCARYEIPDTDITLRAVRRRWRAYAGLPR